MKLTADFPNGSPVPVLQLHDAADDEIDLTAVPATLWRGKVWIALTMMISVALAGYGFLMAWMPPSDGFNRVLLLSYLRFAWAI